MREGKDREPRREGRVEARECLSRAEGSHLSAGGSPPPGHHD